MPADVTSLPVEFLFSMHLDLNFAANALIPNGPHGTRVMAPVLGGTVTGPRITATVAPGADWVTVRADGVSQLDVRLALTTDDGAVIAMSYQGILGADRQPRTAPLFQASDEKYQWLNGVQAVAIGTPGRNEVTYEVYALR